MWGIKALVKNNFFCGFPKRGILFSNRGLLHYKRCIKPWIILHFKYITRWVKSKRILSYQMITSRYYDILILCTYFWFTQLLDDMFSNDHMNTFQLHILVFIWYWSDCNSEHVAHMCRKKYVFMFEKNNIRCVTTRDLYLFKAFD